MAKDIRVTLELDNSQFNKSINQSKKNVDSFEKSGVTSFGRVATAIAGLVAAGKGLQGIVTTGAKFQDLRDSLNAVFGSAAKGAQAFARIKDFSLRTQFGVDTLTNAFIQLKGAGVEPTEELLMTFADTASVTTDQMGTFQAALDLVSRSTAGGLGLEDLNRLADRGIPVFQILQEQLGLARLEVSEFGKTTEGANTIIAALTDGLNERFGGTLTTKLDNVSVKFSNLKIAIQNLAAAMFDKLEPTLVKVVDGLTQGAIKAEEFVASAGSIEEIFGRLMENIQPAVDLLIKFGDVIVAIVGIQLTNHLLKRLAQFTSTLTLMSSKLRNAVAAFLGLSNILRGSVIVLLGVMVVRVTRTIAVLSQLEMSVKERLVIAFKVFANEAVGAFTGTLHAVMAIGTKMKDGIVGIFTGQGLEGFTDTGKAISDAFEKGFSEGAIFDIPEEIQEAFDAANFLGQLPEEFKDNPITDYAFIVENAAEKISDSKAKIKEDMNDIGTAFKDAAKIIEVTMLETLGRAQVALSEDLATALLEGKSAMQSFQDFFKKIVKQLIAETLRLYVIQPILQAIFGAFGMPITFSAAGVPSIKRRYGGPVMANKPHLVGEAGPEIMIPSGTGTVIPNDKLGGGVTNVNYTIQAVDAPSFQALVASDPEFLFSVTEAGRRRIPGVRL